MNKRTRMYILVAITLLGFWYFFLKADIEEDYSSSEIVVTDNNPGPGVDNSSFSSRIQVPVIR